MIFIKKIAIVTSFGNYHHQVGIIVVGLVQVSHVNSARLRNEESHAWGMEFLHRKSWWLTFPVRHYDVPINFIQQRMQQYQKMTEQ